MAERNGVRVCCPRCRFISWRNYIPSDEQEPGAGPYGLCRDCPTPLVKVGKDTRAPFVSKAGKDLPRQPVIYGCRDCEFKTRDLANLNRHEASCAGRPLRQKRFESAMRKAKLEGR